MKKTWLETDLTVYFIIELYHFIRKSFYFRGTISQSDCDMHNYQQNAFGRMRIGKNGL